MGGPMINPNVPPVIKAPVRVAPGQDASIIAGFDQPTPYGKGTQQ